MALDDDPVIISEKDFTPTPSPSPVPSGESPDGGDDAKAATSAASDALNASAVVSDDEHEGGSSGVSSGGGSRGGTKIMSPAASSDESGNSPKTPTSDDVHVAHELAISISAPPGSGTAMDGETDDDDEMASVPPPAVPSARQIVSVGTEEDSYAFTFHEEELNDILAKVPPGWKVCVVSVVGAFRTGKSFVLSWFLRYLEAHCTRRGGAASSSSSSDSAHDGKKWYERVQTLNQHEGSFDWRGGKERNTTGMWMWSDPYFLPRPSKGDEVAVLLVDTQGMFDHETTVGLTAAIFGLSTLLSSYQIYNVDKRIQEDNLQQLALFSEYGRMAFEAEEKAASASTKEEGQETVLTDKSTAVPARQPFQKIEFLVRDWQNFDTEDESDVAGMEGEMRSYLADVIAEREASDLKETREQINACFEEVGCYMMTHPGFAVIKNRYEGDVSKIEPLFLRLLDRYCERVFDTRGGGGGGGVEGDDAAADAAARPPRLAPKTVRGRELSAVELGTYIRAYARMFEEIGAHFPEPETMLEATSRANNANATTVGVDAYEEYMNAVAGPNASDYHQPEALKATHREASKRALFAFDEMANFGSRKSIEEARDKVLQKIAKDFEMFVSLNDGRNPLLGLETYLLPMVVAGISFVLRWIADFTCSEWSQTCRASSDLLSHIYMVVFFFLVIVASTKAKQISDLLDRVKAAWGLLASGPPKEKHE